MKNNKIITGLSTFIRDMFSVWRKKNVWVQAAATSVVAGLLIFPASIDYKFHPVLSVSETCIGFLMIVIIGLLTSDEYWKP